MSKATSQTTFASVPTNASTQHSARALAAQAIARRRQVRVVRPSKRADRIALIVWPASLHPVTPEVAEAMAQALTAAAKVARDLNIPKLSYFDIYNPDGYYGR